MRTEKCSVGGFVAPDFTKALLRDERSADKQNVI